MDDRVLAARQKAFLLYEGRVTPHRSCGIAMAETFGLPTRSYQVLRRGGLTGEGTCGVVLSGRMVLGEIFGDPDPTGAVTEPLRRAIYTFEANLAPALARAGVDDGDLACNALTTPMGDFLGPARVSRCTAMATEVATLVAEIVLAERGELLIDGIDGVSRDVFDPAAPAEPLPEAWR